MLTHFGIFDPLRVKISTLPLLCFMFYYTMRFICNKEKLEIPPKNIHLLGVAPRDPRAWPLKARKGLTKGQKAITIFWGRSIMITISYKMVLVQFCAFLAYFVTGGTTASERPLCLVVGTHLNFGCRNLHVLSH